MKAFPKAFGVLTTAALVSMVITGCGEKTTTSPAGNTSTPASSNSNDSGVINIGYTGPLSGGAAQYGKDVLNGITMAVDEINAAGGVTIQGKKEKLNIVSLDDKYLPNEAATNAKRLSQQDKTPIVFCPHSGGIMAIQGFNTKPETNFLLAAYSSEPLILKQGNSQTVMIPPSYDMYFKPFAEKEMSTYGKKLGLLGGSHAYGKQWTKGFSEEWKALGGQVLTDNSVDYNTTTDFSAAVSKALAEKPDVMLVGGASQPTALVIKAARDQGYKGGFVVMDQAKFESMQKVAPLSTMEGAVGVMPLENYPGPATHDFLANFKKKFGDSAVANSEVGLNYQAMYVLAKAMELAGTDSDPKAIRDKVADAIQALPKDKQPYGVTGITAEGHLQGPLVAAFVKDGKFENLEIPNK